MQLTFGQRIDVEDLPQLIEVPPGVYGVAILSTAVQTLEATALNAATPLYVQAVIPASSIPTAYTISGP